VRLALPVWKQNWNETFGDNNLITHTVIMTTDFSAFGNHSGALIIFPGEWSSTRIMRWLADHSEHVLKTHNRAMCVHEFVRSALFEPQPDGSWNIHAAAQISIGRPLDL
jgi:hypothetical protein